jgi:hypothetical protein
MKHKEIIMKRIGIKLKKTRNKNQVWNWKESQLEEGWKAK